MNYRYNQYVFIIIFTLIGTSLAPQAYANDTRNIANFIYNISDKTINIIENTKTNKWQKERQLTRLFLRTVDVDYIAEDAVGKFWKTLNKPLQQEFLDLYRRHLATIYVSRFEEYTNEKLKVLKVTQDRLQKNTFYAQTKFIRKNGDPINIEYRIKKDPKKNTYIITDITAIGISLIETQRSEFASVISRHGIAQLFKRMHKRVELWKQKKPYIIKAVNEYYK